MNKKTERPQTPLRARPTRSAGTRSTGSSTTPRRTSTANHSSPAPVVNARPVATSPHTISRDVLRIIPMGGLEEVGANMMAYEFGNDIIIVDVGLAFPDETTPGIDYIIPDTTWLEENKSKIRAVFITHGHLDHIGALPYILPKIGDPPVYTMLLTAGLIKKRLEEFNMLNRIRVNVIKRDDVVPAGNFKVRFFGVNHNIPDSVGLSILTPVGQVIHTGDWKIDHTPINEFPAELDKLAKFGGEGVLALLSDSTNAPKPGYCKSERDLSKTMDNIWGEAKGRIIFASFALLIARIQQVFDLSAKYNRKIVVTGRSMVNNIEIALSLGYLKIQPKIIIKSEQAKKYPDNQIVILTTGAQGEESSALARMSRGEHKTVRIKQGDTVVLSASSIPGNERAIVSVLDNLTRLGANVIYNKILDIHSSGHAQQEELKLMLNLTKPKYFIPIHGERHMLVSHGNIAKSLGMTDDRIFTLDNGEPLEIDTHQKAKIGTKVQSGYVFVDGLGVGDVGEVVIRDRQVMAQDGMFVIIITVDRRTGKLVNQPDILSRGFIFMKNNDDLVREVKHEIRKMVEGQSKGKELEANWAYLRQQVRDEVGEYLFQKTERRPMVLPVIIEI